MVQKPSQNAAEAAPDSLEITTFDGQSARLASGAHRSGARWRTISRSIGLGIFLLGIALLIFVFLQAMQGFQQFSDTGRLNSQFSSKAGNDWVSSLQSIAAVLGKEVLRVLYLFILGYIGSAIAARGIAFFAASEAVIDEAVLPAE